MRPGTGIEHDAAPRFMLAAHHHCPHRLKIAYQITADRLQAEIEFAYRTDCTQVLTTILWGGRIDDVARLMLTAALRAAIARRLRLCIPDFAVAARDLFRHAARTLAARHRARARRGCFGHPDRRARPDSFTPKAATLHDGLLAAARNLRSIASLQPDLTVVVGAEADDSLRATLSALQEVVGSMGDYLEQVLKPLALPVSREAIHAVILRAHRELNELAACRTVGDAYVERLTVTESHDNAVYLEVEGGSGLR